MLLQLYYIPFGYLQKTKIYNHANYQYYNINTLIKTPHPPPKYGNGEE